MTPENAYPKCMQCREPTSRFNHPVHVSVDTPEVFIHMNFCGGFCLAQYISNNRIKWY